MAGSSVIALGAGTIILLVVWTVTGFIWFLLHRSQSAIRYVIFFASAVITLTLFLLPPDRGDDSGRTVASLDEDIIYDYMFLWKAFIILVLLLSLVGGMLINIIEYWTMKVHGSKAVPIAKKGSITVPSSEGADNTDDDNNKAHRRRRRSSSPTSATEADAVSAAAEAD